MQYERENIKYKCKIHVMCVCVSARHYVKPNGACVSDDAWRLCEVKAQHRFVFLFFFVHFALKQVWKAQQHQVRTIPRLSRI